MIEYIRRKFKEFENNFDQDSALDFINFVNKHESELLEFQDEIVKMIQDVSIKNNQEVIVKNDISSDFSSESFQKDLYSKFEFYRNDYNEQEYKKFRKYYQSIKNNLPKPFRSKCNDLRDEIKEVYSNDPLKKQGYKDLEDKNHLNWGGTRSSSRVLNNPLRSSPMFFRRNGSPMDLVDLYKDQAVFIINNGPSFKNVNHSKLKLPGIITYGMNNGAQLFRPNLWSCLDDPTRFLESIWSDPTIMKIVPMAHFEKPIWNKKLDNYSEKLVGDFSNVVGYRRNEKFDENIWLFEDTVNWGNHGNLGGGRSVLIAILRICHLLGFRRIYLLGCDFEMSEDKKYWFDEQRTQGAINNNNNSYKIMTDYFERLKPKFSEEGFEVYNLNPLSGLKTFEFKNFDEMIEKERIDDSESTHGMYVNRKDGDKHD